MNSDDIISGLNDEQVLQSREKNGSNIIKLKEDNVLLQTIKHVVLEPMFILLVIVAFIYFLLNQYQEGIIMLGALILVSGIGFFQNYRSHRAIKALNEFYSSNPVVIRNNIRQMIPPEDVVVGDIMLIEEGQVVAADGRIRSSNDLSVDESILSGESYPVSKSGNGQDFIYKNTFVNTGFAVIEVTAVGKNTRVGKIGSLLKQIRVEKTPLQLHINSFLRNMIWFGAISFVLVVVFRFIQSSNFIQSALQGLTMAMSVLPEEIAVAFSTFLALGAFRLIKKNIIVRHPQYVESLGAATVICLDKTGTITENSMRIAYLYDAASQKSISVSDQQKLPEDLLEFSVWSSEVQPFDAMEKSIHKLYEQTATHDKRSLYKQVHEYPLSGNPPMMTHIFMNSEGDMVIAAKGAPEAILRQSKLSNYLHDLYSRQALDYAKEGFRVLGVGKAKSVPSWPSTQDKFEFEFLGLIAFHDPLKKNIPDVLNKFDEAGISVKILTGDYAETATAIARQLKMSAPEKVITGKEILQLTEKELQQTVKEVNIYARLFPEVKLKVINALKNNGEVVAMTGDGVNDAPALKAAHIGIAMGSKGSTVAKKAASLIITDDNLEHMIDAIALGRKIYDNLKKAIRYIISIHIPIIMIVSLPVLLYWKYSAIFTPVHVIFLELIMGPTCSIIYENEPIEPGTMHRKPLKITTGFLLPVQLTTSIFQGVIIGIACLGIGYYYMQSGADEITMRTIVFETLLLSNLLLTLENRSAHQSIVQTLSYKNNLMLFIIFINVIFLIVITMIPSVQGIFSIGPLSLTDHIKCIIAAVISTSWVEVSKYVFRIKSRELKRYHEASR